jgi:virginiamycin A acetyltransferase
MIKSVGKYTYGIEKIIFSDFKSDKISVNVGSFTCIADYISIQEIQGYGHFYKEGSTYPFGLIYQSEFNNYVARDNYDINERNISIGSDVWVGSKVSIGPGVTIGDGAVIAIRSNVVNKVPPYAIYGGNPARLIKYRFSEDIIEEFMKLKWWDLSDKQINHILPLIQRVPTLETFKDIYKKLEELL